ncbi:MAG: calcium/sodium antiporter [Bacteroidales bacterium]|nr:calcium/sodium antiporter [Bacteroidales bacterium]
MLDIILFIAGIACVVMGANWLVDGSVSIAKRSGISEYVIGATIVGIGTSMPELAVSFFAALKGNADIAIGNVAGSNMANTLLILGVTALISPIAFTRQNLRRDIPITFGVSVLLALFALDTIIWKSAANKIVRPEAIVLLLLFAGYMWLNFKQDKASAGPSCEVPEESKEKPMGLFKSIAMIVIGLGLLILGGNIFVDSGTNIAKALGVSDSLIAISMMAVGTSLPELATCIIAAAKKNNQLALGNILGSNISNILLILGVSGTVVPLSINQQSFISLMLLPASIVVLWLTSFTFRKKTLDRFDGAILVLLYAAYIVMIGRM